MVERSRAAREKDVDVDVDVDMLGTGVGMGMGMGMVRWCGVGVLVVVVVGWYIWCLVRVGLVALLLLRWRLRAWLRFWLLCGVVVVVGWRCGGSSSKTRPCETDDGKRRCCW